jgi:NADH-quinone oxidoreductase subunit J
MIFLVVYVGAIAILFLFVIMMLNIKIVEIHENVLCYLLVGGIIELLFLLEFFFIIDNDYIPILPKKLSTTYLTYIVFYCG